MNKEKWMKQLLERKIVAICRNIPVERIADTVEALYRGGILFIEITFNQKEVPELTGKAIQTAKKRMGDKIHIGAGTVFNIEQVDIAAQAGAEFMLSPHMDQNVIAHTKKIGCISVPGALTATEITQAWKAGADIVKLFPAGNLATAYVKAIRAPINQIPLMAVGGINDKNLLSFMQAGVDCVGIGSNIVNEELINKGQYRELEELVKTYTNLIK